MARCCRGNHDRIAIAAGAQLRQERFTERESRPIALDHRAGKNVQRQLPVDQAEQGLVQGKVDLLALARLRTRIHSRQCTERAHQPAHHVSQRVAGMHWLSLRITCEIRGARVSLRQLPETRPFGVRPGLAESGNVQHDQARIDRMQLIPAQAKPPQHARAKVLDQDVGITQQVPHDRDAGLGLEVQGDAPLVASGDKPPQSHALRFRAHVSQAVAYVRLLDLDHVCAQVSHQCGGHRAGNGDAEFNDTQILQGTSRRRPLGVSHKCNSVDKAERLGFAQERARVPGMCQVNHVSRTVAHGGLARIGAQQPKHLEGECNLAL